MALLDVFLQEVIDVGAEAESEAAQLGDLEGGFKDLGLHGGGETSGRHIRFTPAR